MLSQHNDTHMIFLLNILRHWDGYKGREIFLAVCLQLQNGRMTGVYRRRPRAVQSEALTFGDIILTIGSDL